MPDSVLPKLAAVFLAVAIGWIAGQRRWLGEPVGSTDPARMLGQAAFVVFVPALLFRTTARLDLAAMPGKTIAAFFVPALAFALAIVAVESRRAGRAARDGAHAGPREPPAPAAPATLAMTAVFGNSVQVGIPMAAALFGEAGLGIHVALVSLHALIVLTTLTFVAEVALARERVRVRVRVQRHADADAAPASRGRLVATIAATARATVIHPVTLPVVAGLAFNVAGLALPAAVDETLALLGSAVAPLCLVLIGVSLAYTRVGGRWREALAPMLLKLVVLPAVVLVVARGVFGLAGLPLAVAVMMAALPCGSNALLFAQRYRTLEAPVTAAVLVSTLAYAATAPLWLAAVGAVQSRWP